VVVVYPTIENKNEDSVKETHANENYHSAMDLIALANSSKFYFFFTQSCHVTTNVLTLN
jgi:hypothetical protein